MVDIGTPDIHSAPMRRAGKDLLSLALMDARNHTLRWIGVYEEALAARQFTVLRQFSAPFTTSFAFPIWRRTSWIRWALRTGMT